MKASAPGNETQRLAALRDYDILDTDPEQLYDDLTALAASICRAPMATISLVDQSRQWFKSRVGIAQSETSRDVAFCAHAILRKEPLIVPDSLSDARFSDSTLVTDEPHIRFYAGFPLVTEGGLGLGTLCVMDKEPRRLEPEQKQGMQALARQVMALLELRRVASQLARALRDVKVLSGLLPICAWCKRVRDDRGYWQQVEAYLRDRTDADFTHGICPDCLARVGSQKVEQA